MIVRSLSLQRRMQTEMERHAGSMASLVFYDGSMPTTCDAAADGVKIRAEPLPEQFMLHVLYGEEPGLPTGAKYWRVYDNGGICIMQGDNS